MKKSLLFLLLIPVLANATNPTSSFPHVDTYKVDAKSSKITWIAEKITGKHSGTIAVAGGDVSNNHGQIEGKFNFDMTSINVTDLEGEMKGKLEGHLKSEDFFSVTKFPSSSFEIVSIAPRTGVQPGEPNFNVTGKLTIKGITKDISFPAIIKFEGSQMSTKAEVKVDRTKFDIRYGSKTFFADIGDKAIYDEFTLKLDIVATK